jgi:hypothetical protein
VRSFFLAVQRTKKKERAINSFETAHEKNWQQTLQILLADQTLTF